MTAAHCLAPGMHVGGERVTGRRIGADLALLHGTFPPPYASPAAIAPAGDLAVQGYGCRPWEAPLRPAQAPQLVPDPGEEIRFRGKVCHGDSGGALWQSGRLVGIITALCTNGCDDAPVGYATPAKR